MQNLRVLESSEITGVFPNIDGKEKDFMKYFQKFNLHHSILYFDVEGFKRKGSVQVETNSLVLLTSEVDDLVYIGVGQEKGSSPDLSNEIDLSVVVGINPTEVKLVEKKINEFRVDTRNASCSYCNSQLEDLKDCLTVMTFQTSGGATRIHVNTWPVKSEGGNKDRISSTFLEQSEYLLSPWYWQVLITLFGVFLP